MFHLIASTFKTDPAAAIEMLVSKVNRCDLLVLEGIADFEEMSDLAFEIFKVRTS